MKLTAMYANSNNHFIYKYISSITKSDSPYHNRCTLEQTLPLVIKAKPDCLTSSLYNNDKDAATQFEESTTTCNCTPNTLLNDIVITTTDVHEVLVSLDQNKAMGPDGISPKILKYCADVLCQQISYLFS